MLPPVEWALGRVTAICPVLGCDVEEFGYRGKVTLMTAVLPIREDCRLRHAITKALRETFPVRQDGRDRLAQIAIDRLDPSEKLPGYVDAADILRERGHTDIEIARLAGEFGRDLLLVARQDKPVRTYVDAEFGAHGHVDKEIALYHRVDDARMIEDVLASFRQRQLFKRVMAGLPDPKAKRKHTRNAEEPQAKESPASKRRRLFLEAHGRGRRVQPMQNRMDT